MAMEEVAERLSSHIGIEPSSTTNNQSQV